jgi:hypothetical protein
MARGARFRVAASLVGFALIGALAGCGGGVDTDALEETIRADAQEQVDDAEVDATVESVICPDDLDDEPGTEYECRLEFSDGTAAVAIGEVVEGDEQDNYEFTPVESE